MLSKEDTFKQLVNLHQNTTNVPEFDKMMRSVSPFLNYFELNHFYFFRLLSSGSYTTLGTHCALHEYLHSYPPHWELDLCYRDPKNMQSGVFLEYSSLSVDFLKILRTVFNKFNVKFTIRIQRKTNEGCDFFGFGTKILNGKIDDFLINELNLINKFINYFIEENSKLISMACKNQVNIIPLVGSSFYDSEKNSLNPTKRANLIRHMGLETFDRLTDREKEILQYITNGYPARYIAGKLYLSVRTIEHYIAEIKEKLNCGSKVELINLSKNCPFY